MPEVKYYEVDDFYFEFIPEGNPFKGTLTTKYPDLESHMDQINFGSRSARKRYANAAHTDNGMDAELLMTALAQVASRRREEVAAAAEAGDAAPTEAEAFLMLKIDKMDLFYTSDETCYVSYRAGNHVETWPADSYRFGQYLRNIYYAEHGRSIDSGDLKRTIETLKAKTLHEGYELEVFRRVAEHHGDLYINIGDSDWRVVRVGNDGWEILSESPVKFIRSSNTTPLPIPERGGFIEDLKPFLNAREEDFKLIVGWILGALNPNGPYPLIELTGRQGTAKSTAARILTSLVDPKAAPLRSMPTNERDLAISTSHSHILAFDNISYIRPDLSDALCRVATGGGLATRKLYTDDEEVIFDVKRPIILNGINDVAVRGDLQERTVSVILQPISKEARLSEKEFQASFERAQPKILGAILDVLVGILSRYDTVELDSTPRMADFTRWVTAAERALGWEDGEFATLYAERLESASADAMETDVLVEALRRELEDTGDSSWSGTATELLGVLNSWAEDSVQRLRIWPKAANSLSKYLRRIAPQLEVIGIEYRESEVGHDRKKVKSFKLTDQYKSLPRQTEDNDLWDD